MEKPSISHESGRHPEYDEKNRTDGSDFEAGAVDELLPPDPDAGLSEEEKANIDRKLVRKLDLQLIPWLCLLYLASFLDRTNIGNAKIDGLIEDLHMTNGQYNATLSAMGLVHNFSGLMAARWWLGFTEAGLFPGINYYLSCWYKRSEFGVRAAVFFSAAAVAGSFGGLLAAAITQMDGIGGKPGWAWIFILEGLGTLIIGVFSFWLVHDFPDDARFLSNDDRLRVIRRLKMDKQSSAEHEKFRMAYFWASVKDWKTYTGMLIYMGADGALYAFSLFLPTIISGLGYKSTKAQLLSVPPYAAAAILTIAIGFTADRTRQRGLCNMGCALLGITGFSMLLGSGKPGVQYAGTFLGALGIYPCIANTITWTSNNVEGVYKRGVTLGFVIGWGNLNGVVSSNIYRSKDKPRYKPGHGTVLGYEAFFLLGGSILQYVLLRRENSKRRAGKRDSWIEGKSEKEIELLGDKR
ncbi:MAG: hypothetical protein M1834_006287 [Cirrosporium novae-zelandiae]|nr:MAG: hypothetical protein M1834_006287 [Cirrosporium novae-zelandiae]